MGRENPVGQAIAAIFIFGTLFYVFVWPPLVAWWEANWYWVVAGLLIALGLVGFWFFRWLTADSSSYVSSSGSSSAITSDPTITRRYLSEQETIEEPSLSLFNAVVREIQAFQPFRNYHVENLYQVELARFLASKFPSTQIEQQRELSRPDIVIDDIAIEVKGPTRNRDLRTIADKLMRYEGLFIGGMIVVLFNVEVEDRLYDDWHRSLARKWPNVKVIQIN